MVKLDIHGSYNKSVSYDLGIGQYKIGMAHDADIILYDSYVSGYHAELTITQDAVMITDLGSMNGTFLDSKKITNPSTILESQVVGIGNCTLHVTIAPRQKRKYLPYNRKVDNVNEIHNVGSTTIANDISENDIKIYKEKVYKLLIDNIESINVL